MGKNQGHKARQNARYTGGGGGGEDGGANDGMKDVTFHTAEWHAARIASLTVERIGWEEWRQKQKDAEGKLAAAAEEEERKMREYRAQLDADRARLLSRGRNHEDLARELKAKDKEEKSKKRKRKDSKDKKSRKSKKDKKEGKKSKKSKKRRSSSDGSSSDSSSSSGSDSDSSAKRRALGGGAAADGGTGEDDTEKPMRLSDWLKM